MKNKLSAINLLLLPGAFLCALSCRHSTDFARLPEEFNHIYCPDHAAAGKTAENHAVDKIYTEALQLLADRRNAVDPNRRRQLDSQLRQAAGELVNLIAAEPDAVNTFILAELLNAPVFPDGDRQLAAVLYKYSHLHGLPLGSLRYGMMYAENPSPSAATAAAELLQSAAEAGVIEAQWQLYMLHTAHGNHREAKKALQRAAAAGHCQAVKIADGVRPFEQYLADTRISYARKEELLYEAFASNPTPIALELSNFYFNKPNREPAMAVNSSLLAFRMSSDPELLEHIKRFDVGYPHSTTLQLMWQGELRSIQDLERINLNTDWLLDSLRQADTAQTARREVTELLVNSPEKFFLNNLPAQLIEVGGYSLEELKKLLENAPAEDLPYLLTASVLAGKYSDGAWQLESSTKLLALLAAAEPPVTAINCRKRLMPVIPGVASLSAAERKPNDPLENFMLLWNVAIDMHINALLLNGEYSRAEAFLKKYHRWQLTPWYDFMEKSLVKNCCQALLNSNCTNTNTQ